MGTRKKSMDLLQWSRSQKIALQLVNRYLRSHGGAGRGWRIEQEEKSLITMIAMAISRARLEPRASAGRSGAARASKRAAAGSATTPRPAAASHRPPSPTRRKRARARSR